METANTYDSNSQTARFAVGEYAAVEIKLSRTHVGNKAPCVRGVIETDAGVVHWLAQNDEDDAWAIVTLESPFLPHGWATRTVPFGQLTRFNFEDLAWGHRGAI